MIDAVVFDLDDTICEYRRSSAELLAHAFDAAGVEPFFTAAEYLDSFDEFARRGEAVARIRERCFAAFAAEAGHDPETGPHSPDYVLDSPADLREPPWVRNE